MSSLVDQAREIHKERGPQVAQSVIRNELVPKFMHHIGEVQTNINTARDVNLRNDWGAGYGLALTYRNSLMSLGRLTEADWAVAGMTTKSGEAA